MTNDADAGYYKSDASGHGYTTFRGTRPYKSSCRYNLSTTWGEKYPFWLEYQDQVVLICNMCSLVAQVVFSWTCIKTLSIRLLASSQEMVLSSKLVSGKMNLGILSLIFSVLGILTMLIINIRSMNLERAEVSLFFFVLINNYLNAQILFISIWWQLLT